MSYDITLYIEDAKGDRHAVYDANHTGNTAVMWREAGCDLAKFHMTTGAELARVLEPAVQDMRLRRTHYSQWNPENRWGSYDTTIKFLEEILDACERWPAAVVHVSR